MVSARPELRESRKTRLRLDHDGEAGPISVQIAGADPQMLAEAARYNVDEGAQIIDINMGCPAKKVCNVAGRLGAARGRAAGRRASSRRWSRAVDVPVTLKIRTGPAPERRNALRIARIAEAAGVQALAIHGRTRACVFARRGRVRHDRRGEVARAHPGDRQRRHRHARGREARARSDRRRRVMIGRAAQGRPWIFREIAHYLATGEHLPPPAGRARSARVLVEHLDDLYAFYGERARRARRAQAHRLVHVRALPGRRGVPRASVHTQLHARRRAARRGQRLLRRDSPHEPTATRSPTASSARSSATSRTWTARSPPRSTTW